jgi:organic hydroperoxide reductase OsmC/OhrA
MTTVMAFRFPVSIEWQDGRLTRGTVPGKPALEIATPPEFKHGIPGVWSPEDLLVGAAASCYTVTLLAVAERMHVPVHSLRVDGTGLAARREDGRLGFVSIELHAKLGTDEASIVTAERAAADAEDLCLVSASLDTPVRVHADVTAVSPVAV